MSVLATALKKLHACPCGYGLNCYYVTYRCIYYDGIALNGVF